jgi:hypothetical protein
VNGVSFGPRRKALARLTRPIASTLLLTTLCSTSFSAAQNTAPMAKHTMEGIGTGHQVWIKMADGSVVQGKLTAIDDTSFSVDRGKPKGGSTLSYANVATVKRYGLSAGQKVGIGVGAGVVVVGVGIGIAALSLKGGFQQGQCLTPGYSYPNCGPSPSARRGSR